MEGGVSAGSPGLWTSFLNNIWQVTLALWSSFPPFVEAKDWTRNYTMTKQSSYIRKTQKIFFLKKKLGVRTSVKANWKLKLVLFWLWNTFICWAPEINLLQGEKEVEANISSSKPVYLANLPTSKQKPVLCCFFQPWKKYDSVLSGSTSGRGAVVLWAADGQWETHTHQLRGCQPTAVVSGDAPCLTRTEGRKSVIC